MLAASANPGSATVIASPPASEAEETTKRRRLMDVLMIWFMARLLSRLHQFRSAMNGAADADVGPAAADIGEVGVDIGVGRLRVLLQESGGGHDPPGLTITALRHVLGEPGLLHGVPGVRRKAFDGGNGFVGHVANLDAARPHRLTIDMDCAGAALRDAAP